VTETPAVYDCGGCDCAAIHDLAHERTELMEEMAVALENLLTWYPRLINDAANNGTLSYGQLWAASRRGEDARAVLAKYRGEGAPNAGG